METVFSSSPIQDVALYVLTHFPYSPAGVVGEDEGLFYALEKQGNKVYRIEDDGAECARVIIAVGGSREVDIAKRTELPYVVLCRGVPLSAIQKIGVYDYHILEYGYPKIIFIDESKDVFELQAEISVLSLGIMAEAIGLIGTGLRNEKAREAREVVFKIKEALNNFSTNYETLRLLTDCIKRIDGAPYFALLERIVEDRCIGNSLCARFYSVFSLLYLIREFTNIDFCVILPYMDLVRARMLADGMGAKIATEKVTEKDISYALGLVKDLLPSREELASYVERFRLEAGRETVDFKMLLSDFVLCAALSEKSNLSVDLVRSGYIDALIDG